MGLSVNTQSIEAQRGNKPPTFLTCLLNLLVSLSNHMSEQEKENYNRKRTKKECGGRKRLQEVSFFIARGNLIGQNRIRQACQSNLLSADISDFPFTAALLRVSRRIRSQRAKRCGNTTTVNKHNPSWLIYPPYTCHKTTLPPVILHHEQNKF
ncbi:unnamed protein product [Leuciscus chuanchicus]